MTLSQLAPNATATFCNGHFLQRMRLAHAASKILNNCQRWKVCGLRLQRTKITKEGVTTLLTDPPPKLIEIDVSGNSIPASALRKWKNVDSEHRKYVN